MYNKKAAAGITGIALAFTIVTPSAFATAVEFSDVPSNHWARPYIMSMVDKGIMSGVGGNRFAPSNTLTYAEFLTMITNRFYQDKLTGKGAYWYSPYMDAAKAAGILTGVDAVPTNNINRYEMAQIMYNVLKKEGATTSPLPDTSKVSDWSAIPSEYQDAVSVCYNMELLSGTDANGTFSGNTMLDRAQAAVVMDKLIKLCAPSNPAPAPAPKPESGAIPPGATQITKREQLDSCDGMVETSGGFHCTGAGVTYGSGRIGFFFKSATSLSFTVRAVDEDVCISSGKGLIGRSYTDRLVMWESVIVKKGTSKTFTYNVSDADVVGINLMETKLHGCPSDCYITDIYLY